MLTFNYDDLYTMIADLDAADQIIGKQIVDKMAISLDAFQQAVQVETPVNAGAARGSIMSYTEGSPLDLTGTLTIEVNYGEPLEYGRAPGRMPPPPALELWIARKWGLTGDELVGASWALARHIAKHGTIGAHMFEKGWNNALPAVTRLWENLPGAIVEMI